MTFNADERHYKVYDTSPIISTAHVIAYQSRIARSPRSKADLQMKQRDTLKRPEFVQELSKLHIIYLEHLFRDACTHRAPALSHCVLEEIESH
jgi:hypothetical protein